MEYLVLIADVISSKEIEPRRPFQRQLMATINRLNHGRANLVSPYTLTLGDEFQAVFSSGDKILTDMIEIMITMHPNEARYSYGIGSISTDINPREALSMDGPAFHLARAGIKGLKEEKGSWYVAGLPEIRQDIINAAMALALKEMKQWHPNRLRVLQGLVNGLNVKDIAGDLDITTSAVYKNIDAGGLKSVRRLFNAIEHAVTEALTS